MYHRCGSPYKVCNQPIEFIRVLKQVVGAGGLEPPRTCVLRILSPVCLPIPPRAHKMNPETNKWLKSKTGY